MEVLHNLELTRLKTETEGRLNLSKQKLLHHPSPDPNTALLARECEKMQAELDELIDRS